MSRRRRRGGWLELVYFVLLSGLLLGGSLWLDRRAAALKGELVGRHEVAAVRLGTRGFGASRPLEPNTTLEGRARNRRVELVRPCEGPDSAKPHRTQ